MCWQKQIRVFFMPLRHLKEKRPKELSRWSELGEQWSWAAEWKYCPSVWLRILLLARSMPVLLMEEQSAAAQQIQNLCWKIASQLPQLHRKVIWSMGSYLMLGSLVKHFSMAFAHIKSVRRVWEKFLTYHEDCGYEIIFCYLSIVLHSDYLLIVVENFHFHVPPWKIVFYAQDVLCGLFPFPFVLFVGILSFEEAILGVVYLLLKYYISVEDFFFKWDTVDWTCTVQENSFI